MSREASRTRDLQRFIVGGISALLLTCLAFGAVVFTQNGTLKLAAVAGCGLLQCFVHFRAFLFIEIKEQPKEDVLLILFTTLVLAIMVLGTVVVLGNLDARM